MAKSVCLHIIGIMLAQTVTVFAKPVSNVKYFGTCSVASFL